MTGEEISEASLPGSKTVCRNHPMMEADYKCSICDATICKTCAFLQPDGTSVCFECYKKSGMNKLASHAPRIPEGAVCTHHPGVPAVQLCQMCKTPICKVCDFEFPGNVHVCPNCVNKPVTVTSKQQSNLVWSYILAAIGTFGYFFNMYFAVELASGLTEQFRGLVFMLFVLGPSITGLSLAVSARTRNRKTPLNVFISMAWNGLIIGIFFVFVIIGVFMR